MADTKAAEGTAKTTDTEIAAAAETKKENAVVTVSYIGPNIPRLGLTKYQVYSGGIPAFSDVVTEEQKAKLTRLFIPISQLSTAMEAIEKKGTSYNKFYTDGVTVRKELNQ
ncbi:hypothetical protein [Acidaminococcus sp.]|uniref:hypothetical protein n=1 Tax=Acidaminococcus sp. TaxID=1872103 RepID=UPI003D7CC0BB